LIALCAAVLLLSAPSAGSDVLAQAPGANASLPQPAYGSSFASNVTYGTSNNGVPLLLDVTYSTDTSQRLPAAIVIHGGAWSGGDKTSSGPQGGFVVEAANDLAAAGYVVFNADYRLAPPGSGISPYNTPPGNQAHGQDQVDDMKQLGPWVYENAANYGADQNQLVIVGASAGGHLLWMLIADGPQYTPGVVAVADWSGPVWFDVTDGAPAGSSLDLVTRWTSCPSEGACAGTRNDWVGLSPYDLLNGNTPQIPAVVLQTVGDKVNPVAQARALDSKLTSLSWPHQYNEYSANLHAFNMRADTPATHDMLAYLAGVTQAGGSCVGAQITGSAQPASPQPVGRSVIFTTNATCYGGAMPEYAFSMQAPGGQASVMQDYSSSSSFAWDTTAWTPGTYIWSVQVRAVGSNAFQATDSTTYQLQ
jgi:acetyl esterase/lipase